MWMVNLLVRQCLKDMIHKGYVNLNSLAPQQATDAT